MNRFNLIGLLHKSQLKLFVLSHREIEQIDLTFPEDTVSKSDIFDPVKFSFDIKNQLIKRPELRGSTILFLLPNEKIVTKTVSLTGTSIEAEKKKFFTDSPITEEESWLNVYSHGNVAQFNAVPQKLITDIENSISKIGFKVVFLSLNQVITTSLATKEKNLISYVLDDHLNLLLTGKDSLIAATEIDLGKEKEESVLKKIDAIRDETKDLNSVILLTPETWIQTYLDQNNYKVGLVNLEENIYKTIIRMIQDNKKELSHFLFGTEIDRERKGFHIPWRLIGFLIGLVVVAALGFGAFLFAKGFGENQAKKPKTISPVTATPTQASSSATLTASPSAQPLTPTPVGISKTNIKISVLNGNGIPGDAGRFEKKLNTADYATTNSDTADKQGNHDTSIKFSPAVTPEFKAEIQKLVEGDYAKVVISTDLPSGNDVEIITGTRK